MPTPKGLPPLKGIRSASPRPRRLRALPVEVAQGPRPLGLARAPARIGGPGEPPEGFVSATTSKSEWVIYWALAQAAEDPKDPRKPPWRGGDGHFSWSYQTATAPGKPLGSAVVDFVVYLPRRRLAIRLQTARFHVNANAAQQAYDRFQRDRLGKSFLVVDIFEQDFLGDESGQAAVKIVKAAIALAQNVTTVDPIASGRALRRPQLVG